MADGECLVDKKEENASLPQSCYASNGQCQPVLVPTSEPRWTPVHIVRSVGYSCSQGRHIRQSC